MTDKMNCHQCGKEISADSAFCRHCGAEFKHASQAHKKVVRRISKKTWIIVAIVILLSGGTAYAAPKVNDYIAVNGAIGKAEQLQSSGDYSGALAALTTVEGRWSFASTKQELEDLKGKETSYVQDQTNFNLAVSKESSGDLQGAQKVLQSISSDYPDYAKVQSELDTVATDIQGQLQNQAQQALDQAKAAEAQKAQAQAQAAQAAQDKAQAQAAAAAAAQAQSQAAAAAATEAAQAAQAQAAAQQQALISFYNQLKSIYQAVNNDGTSYYNNAMSYYNVGSTLAALAGFGQAQALYQKAYSDAASLNSGFTGLPTSYVNAGYNMASAADDCLQATNVMINNCANGTNVDASSYTSGCNSLMGDVNAFLSVTTP